MVGSVGAGTFSFILLFVVLIILLLLYRIRIVKLIFWVYLLCLIIVIIVMALVPVDSGQQVVQVNEHVKKMISFGVFIFLGFILSLVFYLIVVLLHQDFALVIPST